LNGGVAFKECSEYSNRLFLAVILATIGNASFGQGQPSGTPKTGAVKKNRGAKSKIAKKPNCETCCAENGPATPQQTSPTPNQSANTESDENIKTQRKLISFTFWLVVVGFIQAAILALTIWAIAHQTKTTKDTERAWVIANPVVNAPDIGFTPQSGNNLELHQVGSNQQNAFVCSFKCTGNTTARLVEGRCPELR
jgi:hypothetical protein